MTLTCTPSAVLSDVTAAQSALPPDVRCVVPAGVLDVPMATAYSLVARVPLALVRGDGKNYGTGNVIEGELPPAGIVALIWGYSTNEADPIMAAQAIRKAAPMVYLHWHRCEGSKQ